MPTYSFGEDSPLKFEISDKLAQDYNGYVDEFLKAQRRFTQKFGRKWDPDTEPIAVAFTKRHKKAAATFAKVLDAHVENDGRYYPSEIMDDFLVRNAVSAVSCVPERWLRVLGAATMAGALYGFLRGR